MKLWNRVPLAELAESVDYGVTASATFNPEGPKFLRITDIQDNAVNWETVPWCECDSRSLAESQLRSGDIVFARTGATTGKSYLIKDCPPETVFASYLIRVRVRENIEPSYVSHFFQTTDYWSQITQGARGAAQPGVNATTLKALEIPVPPLSEQRRIAAILDQADALRVKRREALAQLDSLTQSIFIEMFGDPRENEKGWTKQSIGTFISDMRGGAPLEPDDFIESGFPILHKGAIKRQGQIYLDTKKNTFVAIEYATAKPKCVADREFVAVTLRDLVPSGPSIGLAADLRDGPFDEYVLAQGAYAFRIDPAKVTTEYFVHLSNMPTFRYVLLQNAVGSTQIHIRTPIYLAISVPCPPIELQRKFSQRVRAVENMRRQYRASLTELDSLFASLQHRAFRGEL